MTHIKIDPKLNEVHGELTRLLLLYWEIMGRPDLPEFISLIPMDPALEHIEKAKRNEFIHGGFSHKVH